MLEEPAVLSLVKQRLEENMVAECRYIIRVKQWTENTLNQGLVLAQKLVRIWKSIVTSQSVVSEEELREQQRKAGAGLWNQKQSFCNMVLYVV